MRRPVAYLFKDRGAFSKRIAARDPNTGEEWAIGERSESDVLYLFSDASPTTRKKITHLLEDICRRLVIAPGQLQIWDKYWKTIRTLRANKKLLSRLESIDWDFAGDRCASAFAGVHWHPCRFVAQIPAALIGLLSKPGDVVLDPFVGSGTTLVEARRLGRRPIGIDINPISILLCRSETLPNRSSTIKKALGGYKAEFLSHLETPVPVLRSGGKFQILCNCKSGMGPVHSAH